jgi:methionine-gamma-lyase
MTEQHHPDTLAVHPAFRPPTSTPAAVPLYQTATFGFDDLAEFADAWSRPDGAYTYSRMGNPTTRALEDAVAALEGGAAALATASGMGAISTVLLALLNTGDHVLVQRGLYGGTTALLRELAQRWGLRFTAVDVADPEAVRAARTDHTRMLYLETIANPMGEVCDIPQLAAWARAEGLLTVVDNTFASPVLYQPLRHGADVVVHSTTKYIGGHADVVGGIAVVREAALHQKLWHCGTELGASADPFAAWLTLRGLQTLPLRMRRQEENARVLAERLAEHPAVAAVHWAGLPAHPSHAGAKNRLAGFGAVFSFDLVDSSGVERFIKRIRLVQLAPSLGGLTTTVLHPRSTSHSRLQQAELDAAGIGSGTLRVATGLEHPDDLWNDVRQALE